jgi:hypothetical protein
MKIQDFNLKFASANDHGSLFQALRNLSIVEDFKSLFSGDPDSVLVDWAPWPPVASDAVCGA